MADNKLSQKHLIAALANDFKVSKKDVQNIKWTESAGAGVMDGFTTEDVMEFAVDSSGFATDD